VSYLRLRSPAILNSVYEAYHGSISTFELSPRRFTFSVGVIPDLIPHAPSSTGPVLFTMAKVKLWTHPASTMSRTVPTKSAADVLLRVDRHSFLVATSLCGRINHATWVVLRTKNGNGTSRPACADSYTWKLEVLTGGRHSNESALVISWPRTAFTLWTLLQWLLKKEDRVWHHFSPGAQTSPHPTHTSIHS
jgi:hypothetical protein